MIDEKVNDAMLMAYADGELEVSEREAIASLAARDPLIAARIAGFARTVLAAQQAFADDLAEPVPPALVAAVTDQPLASRNWWQNVAMPLAACLVIAAGLGGYFIGAATPERGSANLLAIATGAEILNTLATAPSGTPLTVSTGGRELLVEAGGTYATDTGFCRLYAARAESDGMRGLTCLLDEDWEVPVAVLTGSETYRPASEGALAVLDAALDSMGAGGDIGAEAEAELIVNGWR